MFLSIANKRYILAIYGFMAKWPYYVRSCFYETNLIAYVRKIMQLFYVFLRASQSDSER